MFRVSFHMRRDGRVFLNIQHIRTEWNGTGSERDRTGRNGTGRNGMGRDGTGRDRITHGIYIFPGTGWDGRDLRGQSVVNDTILCHVYIRLVYLKESIGLKNFGSLTQ